jgi:hypothetical protein
MTLTLQVSELKTESLRLESTGSAGTMLVELGPSGGLSGAYRQFADYIELDHVVAALLTVGTVHAPVGAGRLEVPAQSLLRQLAVDGRLELLPQLGFRGTASVAEAITTPLAFEWEAGRSTASLEVNGVRYESEPGQTQRVQVERLALTNARVELGQSIVSVGRLALEGIAIDLVGAHWKLTCAAAQASGIHVHSGPLSLEIESIRLPGGFLAKGDHLSFGRLDIGTARLSVAELPTATSATASTRAPAPLPDLPFLDDVSGYLNVDVSLDLELPVIRSRRATHRFRVPMEAGAIHFKQLERGLSSLEDAVLDFEVTEDSLILERDLVPGVTFDNQTLVSWPLEGTDHDLAKRQKKVRLRRLMSYELSPALRQDPNRVAATDSMSAVGLRQLDVTDLELVVSLDQGSKLSLGKLGELALGNSDAPPLRSLRVAGELHFAPGQETAPSEIGVVLDSLVLGASELDLGGWQAHIAQATLHSIDAGRIRFSGIRPAALEAALGDLSLADVRLGHSSR